MLYFMPLFAYLKRQDSSMKASAVQQPKETNHWYLLLDMGKRNNLSDFIFACLIKWTNSLQIVLGC